ncbi:hypothetical protein GCM10009347_26480 [Shewanella algicola]|uniref:Uncharacterized protein n=1 Tax=Shewanella algicola TaxID=640633 RepID=A0A9X1ZGD5_9GAMM|nr:hypothetical protein [Shewanella algicola]MCL1106378.1 hypothetical protein [Shewanella algicola]GGP58787.1 hypothetical protein GCM10009347_26480 [Shewanella algicola]
MEEIKSQLEKWVLAAKQEPERNAKAVVRRLLKIETKSHYVESKDLPPIG